MEEMEVSPLTEILEIRKHHNRGHGSTSRFFVGDLFPLSQPSGMTNTLIQRLHHLH
jgi:hypothetical protein